MKTDVLQDRKSAAMENVAGLFKDGNFPEVIKLLTDHLTESPNDIEALHLLGTAYARANDFRNAEKTFKQELALDNNQADAYFNLGLIHSRQNRIAEAIEDFEKALQLSPDDLQALNDLGVLYFNQGNAERARELFTRALDKNHAFKNAFLNIFELLWSDGQYTAALEHAYEYLNQLSANVPQKPAAPQPKAETKTVARPTPPVLPVPEIDVVKAETKGPAVVKSVTMKKSSSAVEELFNKHVPEHLRDKKTGMNIAVVADFNIAGQLTGMFRLINEHTIHRARCIVIQDDYLSYDKDLVLSLNKDEDWQEAKEIIQSADFFHIGRFHKQNDRFPLLRHIKPDNTIVQYFGSELRQNAREIYNWHTQNRITGVAAWDYTMIENSPFFYHINMMYDASRIKPAPKPEGTLKIVHPTTNRQIKKSDLFTKAAEQLQGKYDIEFILIEGKTNEECLEIKSRAHMTYDQISVGIYGVSAIESMAAGHVVFGGISNFAASVQPDNPIVWITPDNLVEKIKYYVVNRVEIIERGLAGKAWVKAHHDPQKILKQHLYLYDLVKNGHRFLASPDEQLLR
jgi:tetratricopeptide (TPR) repeat protein